MKVALITGVLVIVLIVTQINLLIALARAHDKIAEQRKTICLLSGQTLAQCEK